MLTVSHHGHAVESDLTAGRLACPGCRGVLRPWGWARDRRVRHGGSGAGYQLKRHRPRRARCAGCAGTHVLLGMELASRRADAAAVIAEAIELKTTTGAGHRSIAARLGRPVSTVRGWLRAFTASAESIREAFTLLLHRDGADPASLWPVPAATSAGQALSAVAAYAEVLTDRLAIATLVWHSAGLAVAGPGFFSTGRWAPGSQHQLALPPRHAGGNSGESAG